MDFQMVLMKRVCFFSSTMISLSSSLGQQEKEVLQVLLDMLHAASLSRIL